MSTTTHKPEEKRYRTALFKTFQPAVKITGKQMKKQSQQRRGKKNQMQVLESIPTARLTRQVDRKKNVPPKDVLILIPGTHDM